jgi:hypothetical protein
MVVNPFNLKPAAEALDTANVVKALVAFGIFAMFVLVWGDVLARMM